MNWVVILFTVATFLYILVTRLLGNRTVRLPPGPPFFTCLKLSWRAFKNYDLNIISYELFPKYGKLFMIKLFGQNVVFLNNSKLIKTVFNGSEYRDQTNFRPPSFVGKFVFRNGQDVGFSDYHDQQVKLKKIMHTVVKSYSDETKNYGLILNQEIVRFADRLEDSDDQKSVDVSGALSVWLIRNMHILLTDQCPEYEDHICTVIEEYITQVNTMLRMDIGMVYSLFPWIRHISSTYYGQLYQDMVNNLKEIHKLYLNPDFKQKAKGTNGIIGRILHEQESDPTITDANVKGLVQDTLLATFVGTKGAIAGFLLLMMYYPDIQTQIQQEIKEKIGDRCPTLNDSSELHYTNAAILECLRYIRHGTLGLPHTNRLPITVEGFTIPANSIMFANRWVSNHSPEEWHEPKLFKPERFLTDDGHILPPGHPTRQQLVIFGSGRRMCVGESFVKSRMFLLVTTLLQRFSFQKGDNILPPEDSSFWEQGGDLCPPFLNCQLIKLT